MKTTSNSYPTVWNVSLWTAQILLAAMFFMAGSLKTFTPIHQLAATLPLAAEFPEALVRFIGISEILGAIGLLLPGILRIKPILTAYAALGIFTIMVLALVFHISRGEFEALGTNIGLGILAGFVTWGRFIKVPVPSKPAVNIQHREY